MNTTQKSEHVSSPDCIFCKIVSGDIPANKVYEDDETFSFLDISPVSEGHALVIPKDHFENLYATPAETWCRMAITIQKVSEAVRHAVNADGINLEMNNEAAAGQLVPHAHVHIVPRHNDDGLKHWPGKPYKSNEEANTLAEKIKEELRK